MEYPERKGGGQFESKESAIRSLIEKKIEASRQDYVSDSNQETSYPTETTWIIEEGGQRFALERVDSLNELPQERYAFLETTPVASTARMDTIVGGVIDIEGANWDDVVHAANEGRLYWIDWLA